MVSQEEAFIIKMLSERGSMTFKALNDACADRFEGCRIILKKLKEQGFVSFEGAIPSFNATITFVQPADREKVAQKAQLEGQLARAGPSGDAQHAIIKILRDHGGKMGYKELNTVFSEKYEGLRLLLKRLKEIGTVDYEGDMASFTSDIRLLE